MKDIEAEVAEVVQERTRRIVARAVLRRMAQWSRAEEAEARANARRFWFIVLVPAVLLACGVPVFLVVHGHPKVALFALSILAGVALAVGLIARSKSGTREAASGRRDSAGG